jgi:hypothetical protein
MRNICGGEGASKPGDNPYSDNIRLDVIMQYQLGISLDTEELNNL